jgi:hypothetical protein
MHRVAWSLIAVPVVLWVAVALAARLLGLAQPTGLRDAVLLATYLTLFTYVAMGLVAVPLFLLCIWRRWLSVWHAVAVGAITGFAPFSAPLIPQLFDGRLQLHYRLQQIALVVNNEFIFLGTIGGALFWLMAIWRNPVFNLPADRHASSAA